MKNIKFIPLLLIAFSLMISSCAIDDDDAIIPTGTTITASLDKTGEIYAFGTDDINLDFVLSRAVNVSTLISYTLNGVDANVTIPSGNTRSSLSITNAPGQNNTVVLNAANGLNIDYVSVGSTNTSVTFIGLPDPTPGNIMITQSLNDPSGAFFFTFAGFNPDGSWLADVYGGTTNTFALPISNLLFTSATIDPLYFALDIFSGALNDPGYTIYIVRPDATVEVFSGNDLDLAGGVDQDVVLVNVTDSSVPGEKNYIFTQN